jgi:hypothetical protein
MGLIANYVKMTNSMSQSETFFKREVAPRVLGVGLVLTVATVFFQDLIAFPTVAAVKGEIALGRKIYHRGEEYSETWEKDWNIKDTAMKVLKLALAILCCLTIGFVLYKYNNSLLAKLGLAEEAAKIEKKTQDAAEATDKTDKEKAVDVKIDVKTEESKEGPKAQSKDDSKQASAKPADAAANGNKPLSVDTAPSGTPTAEITVDAGANGGNGDGAAAAAANSAS